MLFSFHAVQMMCCFFERQRSARCICEQIEILQFQQRPDGEAQPDEQCAYRIKGSNHLESLGIKCIAELDCKICVDTLIKGVD